MTHNAIYVTRPDADKLKSVIREAKNRGYRGSPYIQKLEAELERATIVEPQDIPADVITMNSTADLLDLETGELMEFTLVFPDQADIGRGKISVLAPIGTGMLGYRVGDTFEWDTPGGKRTLRVTDIREQPEASGNF
ncbi:MAG TPA: nucleoside diphosphate kinase regulator [Anaerolineales bacterium]